MRRRNYEAQTRACSNSDLGGYNRPMTPVLSGFHTEGGGGGGGPGIFPPQLDFPPPQDFEIQYDVIIIIMYTMDIVQ